MEIIVITDIGERKEAELYTPCWRIANLIQGIELKIT